jgi:hypothetical protein
MTFFINSVASITYKKWTGRSPRLDKAGFSLDQANHPFCGNDMKHFGSRRR